MLTLSKVYLAGPITGLSYEEARLSWRQEIAGLLHPSIKPFSPMRHKDYLLGEKSLAAEGYESNVLSTAKGITTRDRFDCMTSDLVIVNFLDTTRVSIGTCIEFGWADSKQIPIVLIMKDGDLHDHAMIREMAGFITRSVEEAAHVTNSILVPGV